MLIVTQLRNAQAKTQITLQTINALMLCLSPLWCCAWHCWLTEVEVLYYWQRKQCSSGSAWHSLDWLSVTHWIIQDFLWHEWKIIYTLAGSINKLIMEHCEQREPADRSVDSPEILNTCLFISFWDPAEIYPALTLSRHHDASIDYGGLDLQVQVEISGWEML